MSFFSSLFSFSFGFRSFGFRISTTHKCSPYQDKKKKKKHKTIRSRQQNSNSLFGSRSGQPELELWDLYMSDVLCWAPLYSLASQFYLHSPALCLPVCCIRVSNSHLGASGQFCLNDQTLPRCDFHSAEPKQTGSPQSLLHRVSATTGLFSDSLHCNTFRNMPTALPSLPKPFRLLFASVNIPPQHICTYLQLHICKIPIEACPAQKRDFIMAFLVLLRYAPLNHKASLRMILLFIVQIFH